MICAPQILLKKEISSTNYKAHGVKCEYVKLVMGIYGKLEYFDF